MHFPDLISDQKVTEACPLAAKIQNALSQMHSVDEGAPSLGLLRWKHMILFPLLGLISYLYCNNKTASGSTASLVDDIIYLLFF